MSEIELMSTTHSATPFDLISITYRDGKKPPQVEHENFLEGAKRRVVRLTEESNEILQIAFYIQALVDHPNGVKTTYHKRFGETFFTTEEFLQLSEIEYEELKQIGADEVDPFMKDRFNADPVNRNS